LEERRKLQDLLHMFKMKGTNRVDPDTIFAKRQIKHHTRQSATCRI
jgi:hypothetical protein